MTSCYGFNIKLLIKIIAVWANDGKDKAEIDIYFSFFFSTGGQWTRPKGKQQALKSADERMPC